MEPNPWTLEFEETGVKIYSPDGLLAVLSYPISEAGVFEAPRIVECARLMAVSPALLAALESLLSALADNRTNETEQLRAAIQHAQATVALAKKQS
ncbi:MAG TPA: hypothetical protein VME45_22190 [Stellaceae bacterium]|nr:hypothetical protein [Stellaceae bacterium]